MTDPAHKSVERNARIEAVLHEYLQALDAGKKPNPRDYLDRHPDLADDLAAFFADQAKLDQVARSMRALAESATLPPSESPANGVLGKVRYFGDYELLEEIAHGGMGVVYKARQVTLQRVVAVKMILAGELANQAEVDRFYTEARAAANLHHPNIVAIHEVGQHDRQHYFSMDYVAGESLAQRVARGPLPAPKAAVLVKKVAEAVAFAHVEGVIHRDLKPANILLDAQGEPHVTDFGLAKRVGQSAVGSGIGVLPTADCQLPADLTETGQILGTAGYMPPEQAGGRRGAVGPLSDVYSLGSVLYCLLTGRPPFQAATRLDTLLQVIQQEPVSPRQLNAAVPRDLETITLKCLEKEPTRRYRSATELAEELERFMKGEPIMARPVGRVERCWRWCRRNPQVAAALMASVASLLAGTIVSILFAMQAIRNATNEKIAREEADRNATNEKAARDDADRNAANATEQAELARAVQQFLEFDLIGQAGSYFEKPDPDLKLLTAIDRAAAQVKERFVGKPLLEASVRRAIAKAYTHHGRHRDVQQQLETARELLRNELARSSTEKLDLVALEFLECSMDLAMSQTTQGHNELAVKIMRQTEAVLRLRTDLNNAVRAQIDFVAEMASAVESNDVVRALKLTREKVRNAATSPENARLAPEQATQAQQVKAAAIQLADKMLEVLTLMAEGEYAKAEAAVKPLLPADPSRAGTDPVTSGLLVLLGEAYRGQGKNEDALQTFAAARERLLPQSSDHDEGVLLCSLRIGRLLLLRKDHTGAQKELRATLASFEKQLPDHYRRFEAMSLLGSALAAQKDNAGAEPMLKEGYEGLKKRNKEIPPNDKWTIVDALERLVQFCEAADKKDEAARWRNELEAAKNSTGKKPPSK
jgi:serine/threonine protein kinase